MIGVLLATADWFTLNWTSHNVSTVYTLSDARTPSPGRTVVRSLETDANRTVYALQTAYTVHTV